jgi:DNA-directed RNA polymerase subunit beta'
LEHENVTELVLVTLRDGVEEGGRKKNKIELPIFSGDIHFPGEIDKISRHSGILIPPGKTNSKESKNLKNGIYVQRITPTKKKKFFVLVKLG